MDKQDKLMALEEENKRLRQALELLHPCEDCNYRGWLCGEEKEHRKHPNDCQGLRIWKEALETRE